MTGASVRVHQRSSPKRSDLDLLRTYEPVLAFTEGEMFFPMRVEGYIRQCGLMVRTEERGQEVLAQKGGLTTGVLAGLGAQEPKGLLSLRFVEEPMGGIEYRRWHSHRPPFTAKGRLARVGLVARFADAVFHLTFLLRGRVPGGTTAAAQAQYAVIAAEDPSFAYHGRVSRRENYTVLNYQFFYAMNDWRSSFFGVNDHEADWEQIFVYLAEGKDGALEPAWVAYASHDYSGADLRRRWDDPDLTIIDGHPVVFTAAGSHASYFQAGEYVTAVELKFLAPVSALTGVVRRFWHDTLRQGDAEGPARGIDDKFTVPFVDYARGDGVRIGPGETRLWTPVVIDDTVDWVDGYRGLWGLDTRDVFEGELAPAGPKYNRDGSVRQSWYDPIGWAELGRSPPPAEAEAELSQRIEELRREVGETAEKAAALREELPRLSMEVHALGGMGSLKHLLQQRQDEILELETDLKHLTAHEESLRASVLACQRLRERLQAGDREGPKDHIRRHQVPEPAQTFREGRIAELWAALSIGLLFLLGAGLTAAGAPWFTALVLLIGGFVLVDHILRGTIIRFLLNASIFLALATAAILLYEFFWWIALAALAALGILVLANNLREIRAR